MGRWVGGSVGRWVGGLVGRWVGGLVGVQSMLHSGKSFIIQYV